MILRHAVFVGLLLLTAAAGCGQGNEPAMSDRRNDNFEALLETSIQELQWKTEAHKTWGLGTFDRWDIDQRVGNLVFTTADGATAVTPAQIIGSFNTTDNTWLWAWDNPSIADALKRDALKVREYGQKHGIEKLTTRKWTGTEDDAWAMAALAVKLCDAQGAYRGPTGSAYVLMTFGEVELSKRPATP